MNTERNMAGAKPPTAPVLLETTPIVPGLRCRNAQGSRLATEAYCTTTVEGPVRGPEAWWLR